MAPDVVPWSGRDDHALAAAAVLWGEAVDDVRTDLEGLPDEAAPIAVLDGGGATPGATPRVMAAAIYLPPSLLGDQKCALARVAAAAGADAHALALVAWAEARAVESGGSRLEVVERRTPGLGASLEARGYRLVDALVRMRRTAARPVPPLPPGHAEVPLSAVTVEAWVDTVNASFAHVPFSAPATREEYARQLASPGFDAGLVRVIVDTTGPVAFLRGTISAAGVGEVHAIGVVPRAQGRGLGRWVLRRCEELLDARAPREVILRVADSNRRARDLYLREGYVEVARQRAWERSL